MFIKMSGIGTSQVNTSVNRNDRNKLCKLLETTIKLSYTCYSQRGPMTIVLYLKSKYVVP